MNDASEFNGGHLNFVKRNEHDPLQQEEKEEEQNVDSRDTYYDRHRNGQFDIIESVIPKIGRCVIFRHDELHEGGGILPRSSANTKYMLQCDVLYERIMN